MELNSYNRPQRAEWQRLQQRGISDTSQVSDIVSRIISDVAERGDDAVLEMERRFGWPQLSDIRVSEAEFEEAEAMVSESLKQSLNVAAANIHRFHRAQLMQPIEVETMPGIVCRQKAVAISDVGLYIPGGNSPLYSTVLMLAIPAKIAGCSRIAMCSPAGKDGKIHPAILYAARLTGVTEVYKTGGAQAIAAMAIGTATVKKVNKIFGPGNRFVMEAKQQVSAKGVAIDMPAGPSEVMIIADNSANATFVAADFLSQSEHGPDSQSVLLTTDESFASEVKVEIERLLSTLPRQEMIASSLSKSRIIILRNDDEMMAFANEYAPEHLIIAHRHCNELAEKVENAGSVFLGNYACESAGDYASGTNHTLPTSGYAKAFSGVNIDSFTKKITFQTITADGIANLGQTIATLAEGEDLMAHRLAATVRMEYVKQL
ncbi:MAG: histidinol dehydrogenase [Candidatus Limisoma sp.]